MENSNGLIVLPSFMKPAASQAGKGAKYAISGFSRCADPFRRNGQPSCATHVKHRVSCHSASLSQKQDRDVATA
ncbi:MAG: hypothetical protein OXI37_03150 [Gammaproteobacteria bacterium]|nr:hypothetical protein [Gammaproteobacteria bacterium]